MHLKCGCVIAVGGVWDGRLIMRCERHTLDATLLDRIPRVKGRPGPDTEKSDHMWVYDDYA